MATTYLNPVQAAQARFDAIKAEMLDAGMPRVTMAQADEYAAAQAELTAAMREMVPTAEDVRDAARPVNTWVANARAHAKVAQTSASAHLAQIAAEESERAACAADEAANKVFDLADRTDTAEAGEIANTIQCAVELAYDYARAAARAAK